MWTLRTFLSQASALVHNTRDDSFDCCYQRSSCESARLTARRQQCPTGFPRPSDRVTMAFVTGLQWRQSTLTTHGLPSLCSDDPSDLFLNKRRHSYESTTTEEALSLFLPLYIHVGGIMMGDQQHVIVCNGQHYYYSIWSVVHGILPMAVPFNDKFACAIATSMDTTLHG